MAEILILLGAPGAGKGTQAAKLAQALSVPHVSTGDLFRANLSAGTALGERARTYMDQGELVPDEVVLDMLFDRVAQADCAEGYLLDGFPRTIPQADALSARIGPDDSVRAFDIEVDDGVILERLTGRLTCSANGHVWHRAFKPPAREGVCDTCGGVLEQRADDSEEVVRNRLEVYHEQTEPLLDYYRSRGMLESVPGDRAPAEVFAALMGRIGREVA
jgi:adenylate kinase